MNVLEKILEEIEKRRGSYSRYSKSKIGKKSEKEISERITELGYVEEIIRSHMDEVKNDDWIPVEEKLPEESGYYMACIYNEEVDDYDFRKTWFAYVDDYDMDESEWRELYDFERVTAWQPLPEPYKGGEE